jgi:hypothetical protein
MEDKKRKEEEESYDENYWSYSNEFSDEIIQNSFCENKRKKRKIKELKSIEENEYICEATQLIRERVDDMSKLCCEHNQFKSMSECHDKKKVWITTCWCITQTRRREHLLEYVKNLENKITFNTVMLRIKITDIELSKEITSLICKMINRTKSLKKIKIDKVKGSYGCFNALFACIGSSKTIEEIRIDSLEFYEQQDNNINPFESLKYNESIKKIRIINCVMAPLSEVLEEMKTIETVSLCKMPSNSFDKNISCLYFIKNDSIKNLEIVDSNMSDMIGAVFIHILRNLNHTIQKLNLSNNLLYEYTSRELRHLILEKEIKYLDVSNNCFGDVELVGMINAINKLASLNEFYFHENKQTNLMTDYLIKMIESNNSLLNITYSNEDIKQITIVDSMIKINKLCHINPCTLIQFSKSILLGKQDTV